jgi:UDP-glucose 4-epimerase
LEAIYAFEKVSGVKLNYVIGPRRPGDVIAIYANKDKAEKELGWIPEYSLEDIMRTAWLWEQKLKTDEQFYNGKNFQLN